jgi:hypothetical protein
MLAWLKAVPSKDVIGGQSCTLAEESGEWLVELENSSWSYRITDPDALAQACIEAAS